MTDELIAAKASSPATGNSLEERNRNSFTLAETLILAKESEQKALDSVADSFYGAVFFTKTIDDYLAETFNRALRSLAPRDTINVWNKANQSAYAAKILKDEIALLKSKKDEIQKRMLSDARRKVRRGQLPSAPPGVSLENNMQETLKNDQFYPSRGSAHFYTWFYGKVRNGGPWDYKKGQPQYENFGNFHYGAVGTAGGISEQVLLRAAGAAQMRAGTSENTFGTFWGDTPYGDDPVDQVWIKAGIDYAKSRGY
ncbi:polymorphic toxin type 44 domain-containing protein [Pseudomonas sp. NCIMB 10586]|uniref:polymorphic toxin type 44 domain-containing protein n=1 Tax=Pseudomonas sp. NCIMB 10586 TaxID=2558872 RepID=UPI0032B72FD7